MNPRSGPFQFMSIDPAKRQAELEKRFGLSKFSDNKMHLDLGNPSMMGMRKAPNSVSSSPRLQHRVPIFVEGMDEQAELKPEANPTNVDAGQKPRVRVVPIEVETDYMANGGERAFSGDLYTSGPRLNSMRPKERWCDFLEPKPEVKLSRTGPRMGNTPIKVERGPSNVKPKSPAKGVAVKKEPVEKIIPVQKEVVPEPQANGCNASKQSSPTQEQAPPPHELSLKKIAVVLDKLGGYQTDVEKFSGTSKEKQYRYLDEMLTRLMLDLDNVETMGNEDVRLKRKEAIKKVQHCIDLLESKVCDNSQNTLEEMTVESKVPSDAQKLTDVPKLEEVEMKESEEENKPTEVEGEEVMDAEVPASQPEVGGDLPKPEVVQVIEISEVVEGDGNSQEEIVREPIVNEVNGSDDTLKNSLDETLVEDSEIKITEVEGDCVCSSNQSMEVDEAEDKCTVAEIVTELEVENRNREACMSNNIPNSETDLEMNNLNAKHCVGDEGMSESNLFQTNS